MSDLATSRQVGRRRLRVFTEANGLCHWCGTLTRLITPKDGQSLPHDAATIDHVESRFVRKPGQRTDVVLACYGCNQRRARAELQTISAAVLRQRSMAAQMSVEERTKILQEAKPLPFQAPRYFPPGSPLRAANEDHKEATMPKESIEQTILKLRERVQFLERANQALAADRKRVMDEFARCEAALGGLGGRSLSAALASRLAKQERQQGKRDAASAQRSTDRHTRLSESHLRDTGIISDEFMESL